MNGFEYEKAFSRNLGWVTEAEQARLRRSRVAIAGLGGVGGLHLLTLARLGVGAFNVAEFDLANFNRQIGAGMRSLGRSKLEVMIELARDINPELDICVFPSGVQRDNVDDFLRDADVYVDGLDFFALEARRVTFNACTRLGVPALTAAPLGMGVAVLNSYRVE